MLAEILAGLIASAPTAAPPAQSPAAEWKVVVAMPVYQPDGGSSVETATVGGASPSLVHMFSRRSPCDTATAGAREPGDARFGWRVLANTVRTSATDVVVSIDWRRMWDAGRKIGNGPAGTVQLTLHPGDRIPLDFIANAAATDVCRAVGLGLEVTLARATAPAPPGSNLLPLGAVEATDSTVHADLWLVHKLPAGTERAEHQNVQVPMGGGSVTFAPLAVTTPQGDAQVEIGATFRRFTAATGGEFLLVSMSRHINARSLPAGGVSGSTSTLIPLPGPGEVLSLEIPAIAGGMRGGGGGGGRGGPVQAADGSTFGVAGAVERNAAGSGQGGAVISGAAEVLRARSGGSSGVAGQGGRGGGSRGGGGGGGMGGGQTGILTRTPVATMIQAAMLLEGHSFAIRMRMAQ
jgi:hypothetical protein